jgi:hypothetical protein
MNKTAILKVLNPLMAVDFIFLVCTALLSDVIPREIYVVVHPVLGYIFAACVLAHLILNWSWIKNNYLKKKS